MKLNNRLQKLYNEFLIFNQMKQKNRLETFASSAAFFVFVSLIPFIILILSIIPYTPITDSYLIDIIVNLVPEKYEIVTSAIILELTKQSVAILSISAISALWSASRGIQALKLGLNSIHGVIETRNFILLRLSAIFYTLLFIIYIFTVFVFSIVTSKIFDYVLKHLPIEINSNHFIFRLYEMRLLILVPISFIVILCFFWAFPNVKLSFKSQIPGAFFVSIMWYLFSIVFNCFVSTFNGFSMYGSLSFVIASLLWIYFCILIFFIGAQGNYYLSIKKKEAKINS